VYLDGDFAMRFVGALERSLDPIVSTLDSLAAHFSADLAPDHMLGVLASWLGVAADEDLPAEVRRNLVRHGARITRARGTAPALQLLLDLTFPRLSLEIDDGGSAVACEGVASPPVSPAPSFVVRTAIALSDDDRAAVIRVIEAERPVHVSYRLEEPSGVWPAADIEVAR
jgi:phage tail-like protein